MKAKPKLSQADIAVLDSNLLLLFICFQVGFERFRDFRRVSMFTREDGVLLLRLLRSFKQVKTTAYVLAEVSILANKLNGPLRNDWFAMLATVTLATEEAHISTQSLALRSEFTRFGVIDTALTALTKDYVIVTLEHRFSGYLRSRGLHVINFDEKRNQVSPRSVNSGFRVSASLFVIP